MGQWVLVAQAVKTKQTMSVFDLTTVAEQVGNGFGLALGCFFLGQLIWIPLRVFVVVAKPDNAPLGGETMGE